MFCMRVSWRVGSRAAVILHNSLTRPVGQKLCGTLISGKLRHRSSAHSLSPEKYMDTSGIEPDPSRMLQVLSERDNQLHHVPLKASSLCTLLLLSDL